jgi:hypothetical protein
LRVYDIFAEAAEYLGNNDETHVFRTCTRAAEYLAVKGDWDVLKGYVDLPVQLRDLVILPAQVDVPLKFTIDDKPAFSKDRLYEFSLNGFGSAPISPDRTEEAWEDRGFVPVQRIPPADGFRVAIPPSAPDAGKKVVIQGELTNGTEVREPLTIDGVNWFISAFHYGKLTEVNKDETRSAINLYYVTPPPQNDNFAQAQLIAGGSSDPQNPIIGTTVAATVETNEPVAIPPGPDPALPDAPDVIETVAHTVWYNWVSVYDNHFFMYFWTRGGHVLEVFTGDGIGVLNPIARSRLVPNGSAVVGFVPDLGVTYRIRVRPVLDPIVVGFNLLWGSIKRPDPSSDTGPAGGDGQTDPSDSMQPPSVPAIPQPPLPPSPTPPENIVLIAQYGAKETNPRYRMIRLSRTGVRARFLFRRKVFKITSMDDFIPIQSELGFLTMVQAIQALRRKDLETAKALADSAVEMTTDAQRATTGFIELANNTEIQGARNYRIYNRDSVIMLDIFDEMAKILGNVGEDSIFDAATTALEVLCSKGHYDGFTGYVDIQTDGRRYVTLPRFVDQPVTIAINGRPAYMRNKWSEFHLNGPGSDEYGGQWMGGGYGDHGDGRWNSIHAWDSVGPVVTIRPISAVSQLVAIPDLIRDDGKTLRIFGYDETGKRIIDGSGEDGFTITVNHNKLVPNINIDQKIARIDRITRESTSGFVRLYAFDAAQQTTSVLLGYYYPDETEPQYFRIKLPCDAHWIRLRYRKRTLKVTSVWQPLHLYSRMAITTMARSINTLEKDAGASEVLEQKAMKYLDDDQKARNPGETFQLQFNEDCGWNSNFILS